MRLTEIKAGSTVTISRVTGHHHIHERLTEMGFLPGREVTLLYKAPVGTPLVFSVMGSQVALRREEACNLHTGTEMQADPHVLSQSDIMASVRASAHRIDHLKHFGESGHDAKCASCPSCGCQKKSNSQLSSELCSSERRTLNSLPSFARLSDSEELSTLNSQLSTLNSQLSTLNSQLTIALVGNPNCGKTSLFNALSGGHEHTGNYSGVTVHSIEGYATYKGHRLRIVDLPGTYSLHAFSPEEAYVAHELQEGEIDLVVNVIDVTNLERNLLLTMQTQLMGLPMVGALNMYDEFEASGSTLDVEALSQRLGMPLVPTVARKGRGMEALLDAVLDAVNSQPSTANSQLSTLNSQLSTLNSQLSTLLSGIYTRRLSPAERRTAKIDKLAAGSWLAYPLFFVLLFMMFWLTFILGQYPMDWIESAVEWLGDAVTSLFTPNNPSTSWLQSLIVDGIIGGVGSVIVFLPNILILYCLMTILEDSGYLARAALLADPPLSRVGLHGKSFIPMLMGFGCNVPAVMATRTIETGKSRLLTVFTIPLMSCSARIPVYVAFAGTFFARHASLVVMAMYALGIVMAIVVATLLNRFTMRGHNSHFVMELPPYRVPAWRGVWRHTWEKGRQYLRKMAGIILIASMVVWALNYVTVDGISLMEHVGRAIEPLMRPLGFTWQMCVGVLAGLGAKELMISSLGVLEDDTGLASLGIAPAAALAYMVFALLYFPCIATFVAIKNETGHWHHAVFVALYTTAIAYLAALCVTSLW